MNNTLLLLLVGAGAFLWYKNKSSAAPGFGENKALLQTLKTTTVHPTIHQIAPRMMQAR